MVTLDREFLGDMMGKALKSSSFEAEKTGDTPSIWGAVTLRPYHVGRKPATVPSQLISSPWKKVFFMHMLPMVHAN